MIVLPEENRELHEYVEKQNIGRQYDLLRSCIEIGLQYGPFFVNKHMLWSLNHVAVSNLSKFGGRFRMEPVYVGNHVPPHFNDVPELMDRFIAVIHEGWYKWPATYLSAYGLWRLNWIHPFVDGNGRTARALCYYLLCVRAGGLLPGRRIVPERIKESRSEYQAALHAADRAWAEGNLDLSQMDDYLARLVEAQIRDRD